MSVQYIDIENFADFLKTILNKKLDCFLDQLLKAFGKFYALANKMIELLIDLDECFDALNNKDQQKCKQQINNSLFYLNQFFVEYPQFIAWNYCEHFINIAAERIILIRANLHPIFHQQEENKGNKNILDIMLNMEDRCNQISQYITNIKNEINISQMILRQKEDVYRKYNDRLDYVINQHYKLNEDKEFIKYYQLYIHLDQLELQNDSNLQEFFKIVKGLMICCSNLNQILELPIEYAKQIKQQGKKNLKGTAHDIQLMMKYTQILVNKELIWNQLNKFNCEDVIDAFKLFEKQPFIKQSENTFINQFNSMDLRNQFQQKEILLNLLTQLMKKNELINEWNNEQPIKQITMGQFCDTLPQYLSSISHFVKVAQIYQQTQTDLNKFFQQQFQINVQLQFQEFDQFK